MTGYLIEIHFFYFCVIIKGVSKCTMRMCVWLCAHVCGKLVVSDHVLLLGATCPPFGSNMSSFREQHVLRFRKLEMATLS